MQQAFHVGGLGSAGAMEMGTTAPASDPIVAVNANLWSCSGVMPESWLHPRCTYQAKDKWASGQVGKWREKKEDGGVGGEEEAAQGEDFGNCSFSRWFTPGLRVFPQHPEVDTPAALPATLGAPSAREHEFCCFGQG